MIRASVAGSRLEVASSTTSRRGAASISAARVARFASPPDRVPIDACRTFSSPTSATTRSIALRRPRSLVSAGSRTTDAYPSARSTGRAGGLISRWGT